MESRHESSAPDFPLPPAPALFDQRVIDVGTFGEDHLNTPNYAGTLGRGGRDLETPMTQRL